MRKNERYESSKRNGLVTKADAETNDAICTQTHKCWASNHKDNREQHGNTIPVTVDGLG